MIFLLLVISERFTPILAYIDPGTGSLIIQLLLGGLAGVWVILKLFGRRILQFLGIRKKPEEQEDVKSTE